VAASQCTVPLATLMSAPYSLTLGDSVSANVVATNEKGDSPVSSVGNGATLITTPDAPINFVENTALRTPTTLGLSWNEGA
jgi:hypothetical protein